LVDGLNPGGEADLGWRERPVGLRAQPDLSVAVATADLGADPEGFGGDLYPLGQHGMLRVVELEGAPKAVPVVHPSCELR
jgi:hypothetical protein